MSLKSIVPVALTLLAVTASAHFPPRPTLPPWNPGHPGQGQDWINYTTVTGFFLQDEPTTVPGTFDYVRESPSERGTSVEEK
jgi:hypothetical protein